MFLLLFLDAVAIPLSTIPGAYATSSILLILLAASIYSSRQAIADLSRDTKQFIVSILALLAIPGFFLLFQFLPLSSLAHPAWQSAADALGRPIYKTITIDKGNTVVAFCAYMVFYGLLAITAVLGLTRSRAERLFMTTRFGLLFALVLLLTLNRVGASDPADVIASDSEMGLFSCLGIILSLLYIAERLIHGRGRGKLALSKWALLAGSIALSSLCWMMNYNGALTIALSVGMAVALFVLLSRRFGIWVGGIPALTMVVVIVVLVANNMAAHGSSQGILRFSSVTSTQAVTIQRMLDDAPTFGTGAGTYPRLYELYRAPGDGPLLLAATPLSAIAAIELGRAAFWGTVLAVVLLIGWLVICAVMRGRDWIYSTAAASGMCIALALGFSQPLRLNLPTLAFIAIILGLGLAQSRSTRHDL